MLLRRAEEDNCGRGRVENPEGGEIFDSKGLQGRGLGSRGHPLRELHAMAIQRHVKRTRYPRVSLRQAMGAQKQHEIPHQGRRPQHRSCDSRIRTAACKENRARMSLLAQCQCPS